MTNYVDRVRDGVTAVVTASNADPSGLYFFLSLDLVNSTAYKAKNANWPFLTRMFYDDAKSFFANHQYSLKPRAWKYQGDEVLFYRRVQSIHDLAEAVTASYAALRHVSDTVESRTKDASPRLYVKGTCWVANAKYHAPAPVDSMVADPDNRNIVFQSPLAQGALLEFLGPEIDGGFRGSAASLKKALVVSAELASLLHEQADRHVREGLRVVEFRELKGVWGGRHYPIVWYRKDWSKTALDADYEYDDSFRHEILRRAYDADPKQLDDLKGIIETVGHDWLPKLNLPKETPAAQPQETAEATADTSIEVHAVAVCFSPDGKVLLARRHKERGTVILTTSSFGPMTTSGPTTAGPSCCL